MERGGATAPSITILIADAATPLMHGYVLDSSTGANSLYTGLAGTSPNTLYSSITQTLDNGSGHIEIVSNGTYYHVSGMAFFASPGVPWVFA